MTNKYLFFIFLGIEGILSYLTDYLWGIDENIYCVLFIFVNSIAFFIYISSEKISFKFSFILMFGLLCRLMALGVESIEPDMFISYGMMGADDLGFTEESINIYKYGYAYYPFYAYTYFVGTIFNIWGPYELIPRFFNILFSVSAALVLYKILYFLKIKARIITIICSIFLFMPWSLFLSTLMLREALPAFLIAVSSYWFIRWMKEDTFEFFIKSLITVLMAMLFHSGLVGVAAGYLIIYVFYDHHMQRFCVNTKSVILCFCVVLFSFSFVVVFGNTAIFSKFSLVNTESNLNQFSEYWSSNSVGTTYLSWLPVYNDVLGMIWQAPIRSFYFIFSPLPWDVRRLQDIIILLLDSSLYIIAFYIFLTKEKKLRGIAKYIAISCVIIFLITSMIYGVGTFNYGTAIRHRSKFMVFIFIFIALIWNSTYKIEKWKNINRIPKKQ